MASIESDDSSFDQPTNNVIPSFSFSGCGFLGVYHVGVAACLRAHTDVVNRKEIKFAGASAGALVATTLLLDLDFGDLTRLLLQVAKAVHNKEPIDLAVVLRDLMMRYIPEDAHIRLQNRLYVSMTILRGLKCGLVTDFHSKEHLIQCLIASSFVPGFVGWIPPGMDIEDFVDVADGVQPLFNLCYESDTDSSEGVDGGNDEAGNCRQRKRKSVKARRSSLETDNLLEVCPYENSCTEKTSGARNTRNKGSEKESYLGMLVRLCFSGLQTTSRVVQHVPGASRIIQSIIPSSLSGLDGFMEAIITEMMSNRYMVLDGGFSDNIPCFDSNTITICPFAGESDICPRDLTALDFNIDFCHTSMHASEDNLYRLSHALNPMDPELLQSLCVEGYNECLRFLHRKDLLSCKKHLMTRATLSPSPCNIGHAHCRCRLCRVSDAKIRMSLSCVNCHRARHKALRSVLPEDVKKEFQKAIAEYKQQKKTLTTTYWTRLIAALWWCAEKMYSSTIQLADLSIDFYAWLLRFWDNLACFAKFAVLPLGKKRLLVRHVLASLRSCIAASALSRASV